MERGGEAALSAWVGRSQERRETIVSGPAERLAATLDRDDPPLGLGAEIPPLGHWLYFLPQERQSELGPDGHARRGGFLPPVDHLPRRMWAGSRIFFPGLLRVGMEAVRVSTIASVKEKEGASGPLVFVTVRHEIAEHGGHAVVVDEHDIVYRGLGGPAAKPAPEAEKGEWHRSLVPDDVMLFRYSALTFNGHRIHYDRDYVTKEEGYPGLVVHGPLLATLLIDLVRRHLPERRVTAFKFRAVSPVFDGEELHLHGNPPDADGKVDLWAANGRNRLALKAQATLAQA